MDHFVIYHKFCRDGFGAAWAVWSKLKDTASYHPWTYHDPLPTAEQIQGKNVIIVDFGFVYEPLLEIAKLAKSVLLLDHHEKIVEALKDKTFPSNVNVLLDQKRSGAGIAWDVYHGTATRPKLIDYIEDGDLYTWRESYSKEIASALTLIPYEFKAYSDFSNELEYDFKAVVDRGRAMLSYEKALVTKIVNRKYEQQVVILDKTYTIAFVNTCELQSQVGYQILIENPHIDFVAMYYNETPTLRKWSLRARSADVQGTHVNVNHIANTFPGGGGHPAAAGFTSSTTFTL